MTAGEIICEIKNLTLKEQARVITFVQTLDQDFKLNGRELTALAEELVQAGTPAKAERIQARLVAGFYGEERPGAYSDFQGN